MKKYPKTKNGKRLRVYVAWDNMIQRCCNPNHPQYYNYGGRGITVCDEWLSYDNFYEWAYANGFKDNADRKNQSLDRKENDKGYSPENCRWVSMKTQSRNRRNNVKIDGKCLSEIAETTGVDRRVIHYRYRSGETAVDKLSLPIREHIIIDGLSIRELAEREHIPEELIRNRYKKGVRELSKLCAPENKGAHDILYIEGKTFRELSIESGIPIGVLRNRYYMLGKKDVAELLAPYRPKLRK